MMTGYKAFIKIGDILLSTTIALPEYSIRCAEKYRAFTWTERRMGKGPLFLMKSLDDLKHFINVNFDNSMHNLIVVYKCEYVEADDKAMIFRRNWQIDSWLDLEEFPRGTVWANSLMPVEEVKW